MTELWIGLGAGVMTGLAATPHCAGMCGVFPLHLARVAGGRPVARQLLYLLGKSFSYAFLGALAGAFGQLVIKSGWLVSSRHLLAYALGGMMVVFGLMMLGLFPGRRIKQLEATDGGLLGSLYGNVFRSPSLSGSFVLGLATGFLPCPITMVALAGAAATHSAVGGIAVLVGLGVGSAPVLLGIGLSGTLVDARIRRIGLRGAGALVVVFGLFTLLRTAGVVKGLLPHPGSTKPHITSQSDVPLRQEK